MVSSCFLSVGSAELTRNEPVSREFAIAEYNKPCGIEREALFAHFRPLVQRLIRKYGDDPELRQDLRGEIYCRFCTLLDAYDPQRGVPLRPYLVRQLTATMHTYTRRHWRRQRREIGREGDAGGSAFSLTADPSRQWDHDIVLAQVRQQLGEAVALLPLRQRQVVIWRYYESRSFEEIAALLGIELSTARSLLRHGLNNLRRRVAPIDIDLEG